VGAREERVLPAKAAGKKELLQQVMEISDCIRGNYKIIRNDINCLLESQNCTYRNMEAILIVFVVT
jgi:hypothetical protein